MSYNMPHIEWGEIIHPFPNFNGASFIKRMRNAKYTAYTNKFSS